MFHYDKGNFVSKALCYNNNIVGTIKLEKDDKPPANLIQWIELFILLFGLVICGLVTGGALL